MGKIVVLEDAIVQLVDAFDCRSGFWDVSAVSATAERDGHELFWKNAHATIWQIIEETTSSIDKVRYVAQR